MKQIKLTQFEGFGEQSYSDDDEETPPATGGQRTYKKEFWSGVFTQAEMGVISPESLDINTGLLEILQDPAYSQVDPLSKPSYLFDYADFKRNDPELTVEKYLMGNDELYQYAMLVANLRGRLQAMADELFQAEQSMKEGKQPMPDELP